MLVVPLFRTMLSYSLIKADSFIFRLFYSEKQQNAHKNESQINYGMKNGEKQKKKLLR